MNTIIIISVFAVIFLALLPILKIWAKKTPPVLDDKILTLLGQLAKNFIKKVFNV